MGGSSPYGGGTAAGNNPAESNIRLGTPTYPLPPINQYAQAPAPVIPGRGAEAGSNALPPIGAPARGDSPAIAVAPGGAYSSAVPQVDSYDEETYICKTSETFETISERFYHTKKYDRALLLFNRNHPRGADSLRQDPPRLLEGEPIFIPPVRILEKQFTSAIPEPAAAPTAVQPAAPNSGAPASGGERLYRVRKNGEMFWEIARHTLAKGERWTDIWRLNQQLPAEQPVAAGTVLRLPADAQIDPEDVAR
jgi:nucleoid-associated protein YgaU